MNLFGIIIACFGVIISMLRGVIISGSDCLGVIWTIYKGVMWSEFGIIGTGWDYLGIIYGELRGIITNFGIINTGFMRAICPGFAAALLLTGLTVVPPARDGVFYPCRSQSGRGGILFPCRSTCAADGVIWPY